MNPSHSIRNDENRFDRLVDGELTDDEYRQLVSSLDDEPDGWRRCATAFLEAQAWGREFRDVPRQAMAASQQGRTGRSPLKPNYPALLAAIAASFALAFALGLQFRQWFQQPAGSPAANVELATGTPRQALPEREPIEPEAAAPAPVLAADESDPPGTQPWGHATLVMDRPDGSADEFQLPVFDLDDPYGRYQLENSTTIPADIRRRLENQGYQVRRNLRWEPIELDEDRSMLVPYGELEITPVSERSFH